MPTSSACSCARTPAVHAATRLSRLAGEQEPLARCATFGSSSGSLSGLLVVLTA